METLKVGVIGTGAIGQDHIARITNKLVGAKVVAVSDISGDSAKKAAKLCGARVEKDGGAIVGAGDVDALLVCSWGGAHAESVLQAIAAGKPVFCEKPLAATAQDCKKIVDAEVAGGKHLVQVGFMRRYDAGYLQMKQLIDSGEMGEPLLVHCAHRNAGVAENYNTPMAVNDTAIHEIDILQWLINDEYVSAQVITGKGTKHARPNLKDPQMMILRTKGGIVIDIEVFVNCKYGYDIQCEVCCEEGVIRMPEPSFPVLRKDQKVSVHIEQDWKQRFANAYDVEIQQWIESTIKGEVKGPTAWDGYIAAVTSDALVKSQETGAVEPIITGGKPSFYK
ncbi:MAG: Gfo/Idh/MocA family oxidoreductase [Spirochaetes bacterium]|nr:Gfo/Idh/MocA family oxidoreductase [Spirochaetota bacterium]